MSVWQIICHLPLMGMIALSLLAGWALAGWFGVAGAALAVLMVLKLVGGGKKTAVQQGMATEPLHKRLSPGFRDKLGQLSAGAGLTDEPGLGFIEGPPNAFTWLPGPADQVVVVIAESLHDLLSERQLLAVAAHELAHVRAGDHRRLIRAELLSRSSLLMAVAALLGGALAFIVWGAILAPNWVWWTLAIGPTAMSGLHQALSRRNEFHADAEAARLTGDPMALSQALARIQFATGGSMDLKTAFEEFTGVRGRGWWRTHPSVEARIDRLQRMAGRQAV